MKHTTFSARMLAALGLVIVLALGALTFFFTRQQAIPVTGGVSAVRAAGSQGKADSAAVAPSLGGQTDLGAGDVLNVRPDGAQVQSHSVPNPVYEFDLNPARLYSGSHSTDHSGPDPVYEFNLGLQRQPSSGSDVSKITVYSDPDRDPAAIQASSGSGASKITVNRDPDRDPAAIPLSAPKRSIDLGGGNVLILSPEGFWMMTHSNPVFDK